jgi:hypothetical protein
MLLFAAIPAGYRRLHNSAPLPIEEGTAADLKRFMAANPRAAEFVVIDLEAKLPDGTLATRQNFGQMNAEAWRQIDEYLHQKMRRAEVKKVNASRREYEARVARDRIALEIAAKDVRTH